MEWSINKKTLRNIILIVCGGIILYWLLHESERVSVFKNVISGIISPFVLGGVLAFILNVPMRAFENGLLKKINNNNLKRIISVILTFVAMLLVLAGGFWLLIPQLVKTVNSHFKNFLTITEKDLVNDMSTVKTLEEIFKTKGLHEFKKAEFANIVKCNIDSESDISSEIRVIIREINFINKKLDSKICSC